jgi:hypothetical protein
VVITQGANGFFSWYSRSNVGAETRPENSSARTASSHASPVASPAEIHGEIRQLLQLGFSLPILARSSLTSLVPDSVDAVSNALAVELLLRQAVAALGDGPYNAACLSLFGLNPGTRGLPLYRRRRAAADALGLTADNFRREYEPGLLTEVAWEVARMLTVGTVDI